MENNNSAKKVDIITAVEVIDMFKKPISQSTAYNYIKQCREALKKQEHQFLTVEEFKVYYDIKI